MTEGRVRGTHQVESIFPPFLIGCVDWFFTGAIILKELVSSKPFPQKGNHHHPTDEEREAQDKQLFVYHYNQGGEKERRDNKFHPYLSLMAICCHFEMSKYYYDQLGRWVWGIWL